MPDLVEVNGADGVIEIRSSGVVTADDILKSIDKMKLVLDEYNINKVIVDTTEQSTMPETVSIYDIFSSVPRDFKIAIIANTGQSTLKDLQFMETVAKNRGVQMKIFHKYDEGKKWLTL